MRWPQHAGSVGGPCKCRAEDGVVRRPRKRQGSLQGKAKEGQIHGDLSRRRAGGRGGYGAFKCTVKSRQRWTCCAGGRRDGESRDRPPSHSAASKSALASLGWHLGPLRPWPFFMSRLPPSSEDSHRVDSFCSDLSTIVAGKRPLPLLVSGIHSNNAPAASMPP